MPYTQEQSEHFARECEEVLEELQDLQLKIVVEGQPLEAASRLREFARAPPARGGTQSWGDQAVDPKYLHPVSTRDGTPSKVRRTG